MQAILTIVDQGKGKEEDDVLLGLCEGKCKDDDDCMEGLRCTDRDRGDEVPGCTGSLDTKYNYCFFP